MQYLSGPWQVATRIITDYPRFQWRGAMLDVARHFFKVDDVERYIDLLAYYKINMFHIHLSDDQGWRIAINSWPNLALHGGSTAVNGDPGGYYTQADINKVQSIVQSCGKQMIGWEETAQANLLPGSIVQHWATASYARTAAQKGNKIIMSPASKSYMDMKYNSSTTLGLNWAGYIEVQTAYNWDPATQVSGVNDGNILGIEAPLWSETIRSLSDIEYMAFPRVIGYAEIGWTQASKRNWDDYKNRLALQGPRLDALDVNYYKSPQIDWKTN